MMDGRMNGGMDEWMDGMNGCTDEWKDEWMEG